MRSLTQRMRYAGGEATRDVDAARRLDPDGAGYDLALLDPDNRPDPCLDIPEDRSAPTRSHTGGPDNDAADDDGAGGEGHPVGGGVSDPDGVAGAAEAILGDRPSAPGEGRDASAPGEGRDASPAGEGGGAAGAGAAFGPGAASDAGVGGGPAAEVGLPRLGAALAAGLITRGHVEVAVRALARVPEHLANRRDRNGVSGRTKIDAFLTWKSREHTVTTTARIAQELIEALAPDKADRYDPHAYRRRTLTLTTDTTGMSVLRGLLDPATAALVSATLAHYRTLTTPHPHNATTTNDDSQSGSHSGDNRATAGDGGGGPWGEQTELPIRDERTIGTRCPRTTSRVVLRTA